MDPMGSSVTKAKCALEKFFIYCPLLPFMNVAITEKCSMKYRFFYLKYSDVFYNSNVVIFLYNNNATILRFKL